MRELLFYSQSQSGEFFIILIYDVRVYDGHVTGMSGKRFITHHFWEQVVFHELATIPLSERRVARALFGNRFHFASYLSDEGWTVKCTSAMDLRWSDRTVIGT